ncbi:MAG: HD-GYP domain-containing protein [Nitrosomonas sp.]|nr:HD-GYP domain-containing protein [Nitrosomonas sp.]
MKQKPFNANMDSRAALSTARLIHRKVLIRLFLGWLFLCIVIGGAILWSEVHRFQRFSHQLALHESAILSDKFIYDLAHLDTASQQHLTNLAQQLVRQNFLIVELYDLDQQLRVEAVRPGEEATENWIGQHRHQFPQRGEFTHEFHFNGGKLFIVVLVPIKGGGITPAGTMGYFEGIYQVDEKTLATIRSELIRTLLFVSISITFTTLLMYPIIIRLNRRLIRLADDLLMGNLELMNVLGCAIAERDSDTNTHNYRVTYYALRLGEAIGLPRNELRNLIMGAFLHDVGKIGIRDPILLKPGKLTPQEFDIMSGARDVVEFNHEKYDGSGYPKELKGDEIPLSARIFAIADVFDALTSERPYKKSWPIDEAIDHIVQQSNQHFDPQLVHVFIKIVPALFHELHSMEESQMVTMIRHRIARHFLTTMVDHPATKLAARL